MAGFGPQDGAAFAKARLKAVVEGFRVLLPLAGKELHFGSSNDCSDSLVLTALNISKPVLTSTLQALERAD